jgi:hypothetical protein
MRIGTGLRQALSIPLIAGLNFALWSEAGIAAPPPPAPSPPELDQPVNGYDMRQAYQIWRYWVEGQKGLVTEALLAEPEAMEGFKYPALLLRFTKHNDFGHFLTGEFRSYCRTADDGRTPISDSCHYRLRRAYVPLGAATYGEPNPLSEWTRNNFNAKALARHFRAIGLGANTNWWLADPEKMFATAPSPKAVLTANAVIVRLDSRECPQMGHAIEALEGKPLKVGIDLATVGTDDDLNLPGPHAVTSTIKVYLRAAGSPFTMEGSGGLLEELASSIFTAADACEDARREPAK